MAGSAGSATSERRLDASKVSCGVVTGDGAAPRGQSKKPVALEGRTAEPFAEPIFDEKQASRLRRHGHWLDRGFESERNSPELAGGQVTRGRSALDPPYGR
jgi:hypothetical protein